MDSENPIGIIEIGNKNIKCLILTIGDDSSETIFTSSTPSEGIHNGVIVNLAKASNAIRLCISVAEKKAKISLKKINVITEQPEFLCTKFSKHKKIDGSKIYKDDIEFLLKEGKKQLIHNDKNQSIIHIFNYNYVVDGKMFIEEPINIHANLLSHEMTFITIPKNNLKNINQAFADCDIEVERLISCTFALGAKLLNSKELKFGSVLIDIELEKISLGLFKNLAIINSMTLPIGINHITKDISKVCSLNLEESAVIRNNIDLSFKNTNNIFDENDFLKNIYFVNSSYRKISKTLILNIIKARLNEIFGIIKKQIFIAGFNSTSELSFILTGEGSNLYNLEKYCTDFFDSNIKKMEEDDYKKNFFACLGALKIIKDGWETEAIPKIDKRNIEKIGFFTKIFGAH